MAKQKLDTYLDLCTQVYDLSLPKPPEDAYAFYRSYAKDTHGLILEPMCGTGRFLLPLLEEGFDIHGFDASDHMLDALHTKAKSQHLKPNVWKDFVEDLKSPKKYSLIFIPSGSFGLITDPNTVKSALKMFYDHLDEKGILLLELETLKSVPPCGIWRGSLCKREDGKIIIVNRLAMLENTICYSTGKYELVDENRIIQTEIEVLRIQLYDDSLALIEMLKNVGFKNIRMVKTFDRLASPGENDKAIVYECRK